MRVNQTQTLEASGRRAESVQRGNEYAFVIADNDFADFALAADQQADLPVDFTGQRRDLPGKIIRNDVFRRDTFISEAL